MLSKEKPLATALTVHDACAEVVTGLLGVADDMDRALESVPADAAQQKDPAALLKGLRDGIALTHKTLEKVPLTVPM